MLQVGFFGDISSRAEITTKSFSDLSTNKKNRHKIQKKHFQCRFDHPRKSSKATLVIFFHLHSSQLVRQQRRRSKQVRNQTPPCILKVVTIHAN